MVRKFCYCTPPPPTTTELRNDQWAAPDTHRMMPNVVLKGKIAGGVLATSRLRAWLTKPQEASSASNVVMQTIDKANSTTTTDCTLGTKRHSSNIATLPTLSLYHND